MEAARLPGVGNEYLFECVAGSGHNRDWLREPVYTNAGWKRLISITWGLDAYSSTTFAPVAPKSTVPKFFLKTKACSPSPTGLVFAE